MSTKRRNIALHIEGMGSDTAKSAGIAWHYGQATIGTPGNYEWIGGTGSAQGLIEPPQSVGASVDRFGCQLRGNAHSFRLHADTLAKGLFLGQPEKPRDTLSTAIDEDDTTLVFSVAGYTWSASDDGTVVWIGDEAILLGTWSAGGTVNSCTRGYWGTTAQAQPAGMNVYARNPKRINRLARLLVYDRDAGTTTQAWQGFVTNYTVDNGEISVDCQDLWSMIPGAEINRANPKTGVINAGIGGAVAPAIGQAKFIYAPPNGYSGKRINKANATRPHWMAYQLKSAAVYAKLDAALDQATLTDVDGTTAGGSKPALGSPGFDLDAERDSYELLVVDRLKDEGDGTTAVYADMRSSTRDLLNTVGLPFHPVSISMAILTSGYSTYPAGTAAAVTEFGTTVTRLQAPVQYFTNTTNNDIVDMTAYELTDQCLIMQRYSPSSDPGVKLIPSNGGSAVWTVASTGMYGTAAYQGGIATDGTYLYTSFEEDGTYVAANRPVIRKVALSDGSTISWTTGHSTGTAVRGVRTVSFNEVDDEVYWTVDDTGNEMRANNGSDGAASGDCNDFDVVQVFAQAVADDCSVLIAYGGSSTTNHTVGGYTLPVTGTANAASWTLDLDATATLSPGAALSLVKYPRVVRDRNGDGVWITPGYTATSNHPYSYHVTAAGSLDIELDVGGDSGYTPGTYNGVGDIAVDKFGHSYHLLRSASSGGAIDVVRYDETGTFVYSWAADGVANIPDNGYVSIAVDESGNIYLGDVDGYVVVFSQT